MKKEYTLRECLENIDREELLDNYLKIKEEQGERVKNPKKLTKEDLIDLLLPELIDGFRNFLIIMDKENIEELINEKIHNEALELGFMYIVNENNKKVYVVPKEFKDLYNEMNVLNSDISRQRFRNFVAFYALINGMLKRTFILEIVKYHYINIEQSIIDEEMKNLGYILDDDYYINAQMTKGKKEIKDKINNIKKLKEKMSYKIVSEMNIMIYQEILTMISENLASILEIEVENAMELMALIVEAPRDVDDIIDDFKKYIKINRDTEDTLEEFLDFATDYIRYWTINGRTLLELNGEKVLKEYLLDSKPKDSSLLACLQSLNKEIQKDLLDDYCDEDCTLEQLAKEIKDVYEDEIYNDDLEHFKVLKNCHNKEVENIEEFVYEIKSGHIYIYKEDGKVKIFIPKEIKKIMDNADPKEFCSIDYDELF